MDAKISVTAARPSLKLVSAKSTPAQQPNTLAITLTNKDDIPLNGALTFVVQTASAFPRDESIEVATANNSVHTKLSVADNTLVLQDDHTRRSPPRPPQGLRSIRLRQAGHPRRAGRRHHRRMGRPRHSRPHTQNQRHPVHRARRPDLHPQRRQSLPRASFAAAKDFAKPTDVPTGFAETTSTFPTPADGSTLYVKLRDDPNTIATVTLPTPLTKTSHCSSFDHQARARCHKCPHRRQRKPSRRTTTSPMTDQLPA